MISQSQSQSGTSTPHQWFQNYRSKQGSYDECLDEQGKIRPHWRNVARQFESIPHESWNNRQLQLDKLIRDYGLTYDLYSEDSGSRSQWSLDMIPNCLEESELKRIEEMLGQRALLLNMVLGDIYGRQRLLTEGLIDPYLILGNPGYLRPCHGLLGKKQKHIHVYAADIARSPNGDWWVLSDRLESGSGLGYALEHRALMSRVFPAIMAESGTKSLQPFVNGFCRYIDSLAPRHADSPRVALLSSGPKHPNYFEQSFLARNLGYHLVQGADLMVRNGRLYMKTVSGIQAIDVLLRRVNSAWCDPLELRNDSLLGVPGLVDVIRQGNLTVANGLGSAVAESTALPAFLPTISLKLLGERLECPSVATWWCGQKSERDYVLANLDTLVIKPTFRNRNKPIYYGPQLGKAEKAELLARIQSKPEQFCAQEILSQATIPGHDGMQLSPKNFVMRVLMVPSANGWEIMPGGLVRYGESEQHTSTSLQHGGRSKDTWVINSDSSKIDLTATTDLPPKKKPLRIKDDLSSRTADNLFWLGRYLERSEAMARLLNTLSEFLINQASSRTLRAVTPFINQLPESDDPRDFQLNPETLVLTLAETEQRMLQSIFQRSNELSLLGNLGQIERSASLVKERLSSDTWFRLQSVFELVSEERIQSATTYDDNVIQILDGILTNLSGFIGNLMENMTRSLGWTYLQVGRRIERSLAIARLLRDTFETRQIEQDDLLDYLLVWADSSITYRRLYLNTMNPISVLDVICFDKNNPRSLAYQANEMQQLMTKLPHQTYHQGHAIDRSVLKLLSRIGLTDADELVTKFRAHPQSAVAFFDDVIGDLQALSDKFTRTYFTPSGDAEETARPLSI